MANKYVLIQNGRVKNVIVSEAELVDDMIQAGAADASVMLNNGDPSPNIGDVYANGNFSTALSKPLAISQQLTAFRLDLQNFIDSRYDINTRLNFQTLYTLALNDGKANRLAYLQPMLSWVETIISYSITVAAQIQGQATAADVLAYKWDFTSIASADPHLTLLGAISIPD
jgi:hypothetical protein